MNLEDLKQRLRAFAEDRDWDQFHSPKNLSMALAAEVGELLELFQWLTEDESRDLSSSPTELDRVQEELADILIYLIRLADKLDIDLESAALDKIRSNAEKYPVEKARGRATKYHDL